MGEGEGRAGSRESDWDISLRPVVSAGPLLVEVVGAGLGSVVAGVPCDGLEPVRIHEAQNNLSYLLRAHLVSS